MTINKAFPIVVEIGPKQMIAVATVQEKTSSPVKHICFSQGTCLSSVQVKSLKTVAQQIFVFVSKLQIIMIINHNCS